MKDNVRRAVRSQRDVLMKKRNVTGVMSGKKNKAGIKTDEESVVVLVEKKESPNQLKPKDMIPAYLSEGGEAIPTDVIEVGELKALHTDRHRPVVPGTSIGHFAITAGTLGLVVQHADGEKLILSNNHVLANENNARIGDAILQPGPIDGGTDADKIGELHSFVPIDFHNPNLVDAALARFIDVPSEFPDEDDDKDDDKTCRVVDAIIEVLNSIASYLGIKARFKTVNDKDANKKSDIREGEEYINQPLDLNAISRQIAEVEVGDIVKKSGRTTRITVDEVLGVDAGVFVRYTNGVATFEDQIICGPMSAGGDSGSVVYDSENNAIGLLFAGSDKVTILNRIQDVFSALDIEKIA